MPIVKIHVCSNDTHQHPFKFSISIKYLYLFTVLRYNKSIKTSQQDKIMTPIKRIHNEKVHNFACALDRLGWRKVCLTIGYPSGDKFQLARDALNRGQAESIVSDFLADAETLGQNHSGNPDIYDVLKSLN